MLFFVVVGVVVGLLFGGEGLCGECVADADECADLCVLDDFLCGEWVRVVFDFLVEVGEGAVRVVECLRGVVDDGVEFFAHGVFSFVCLLIFW